MNYIYTLVKTSEYGRETPPLMAFEVEEDAAIIEAAMNAVSNDMYAVKTVKTPLVKDTTNDYAAKRGALGLMLGLMNEKEEDDE